MKRSKLITLILALALIVTSIVAVAITAGAEEAVPTIGSKNLYYWTDTSIGVQVNYSGTGTAGLMVYDSNGVTDLAAFNPAEATPIWQNFKKDTYGGVDFYLTQPIPANDMSYPYILVAAAKVGEEIVYGEMEFYSVTAYAYERLSENPTAAQKKLYMALVEYSKSAEGALGTNGAGEVPLAHLEIVNGTYGQNGATLGGINGDTYRIAAEATNVAGEYFCGWYNENDELVSTERVFNYTIPADASGAIVYNAVYGTQEESIYKNGSAVKFEELVTGQIKTKAVNSSFNSGYTSSLSPMYVVEDADGNKAVRVEKKASVSQNILNFYPTNTSGQITVAEFDITLETWSKNNNRHFIVVSMTDGTSVSYTNSKGTAATATGVELRVNFGVEKIGSVYCINFRPNGINSFDGRLKNINTNAGGVFAYTAGETITIKMVLNIAEQRIDYYINGDYLCSGTIATFYATYDNNTANKAYLDYLIPTLADPESTAESKISNAYINYITYANFKDASDIVTVDNVNFK